MFVSKISPQGCEAGGEEGEFETTRQGALQEAASDTNTVQGSQEEEDEEWPQQDLQVEDSDQDWRD